MNYTFNYNQWTDNDFFWDDCDPFNTVESLEMEELKKRVDFNQTDWFICTLYGSQNYGLSTSTSDVDCCLIKIPSPQDIDNGNFMRQLEIDYEESQEHMSGKMVIKDYRSWFKNLRKPSFNCLEYLFSKYIIVNPKYRTQWSQLINYGYMISKCDYMNLMNSMGGMAISNYKKYKETKDPKCAAMFLYMYSMTFRYVHFEQNFYYPFYNHIEYLRNVKKGKIHPLDSVLEKRYNLLTKRLDTQREDYKSEKGLKLRWTEYNYRPKVDKLLSNISFSIMRKVYCEDSKKLF